MSAFGLLFLTRNGCELCEETRPLIVSEAARRDADVQVVDVDSDPDLKKVYGDRVPVVLVSATSAVVAEGRFTKRQVRKALKAL